MWSSTTAAAWGMPPSTSTASAGPWRPTSTVTGAAILNAIVAESVGILVGRGRIPEVFASSNIEGGDAVNTDVAAHGGRSVTRAGASPFAIRGVIEGFYGNPWSPDQRLEMVDFIAARGMNTFVYGPKDDPLVRRLWREPYAGDGLARLSGLVARCDDRGVDLVYCLSPGLSIRYSSADDISVLCAKLDSVARLGVRAFGLLLDDIPAVLQHAEDRAAFADLADAHVDVIGRVLAHLGAAARLLVCPTTYWGYGTEPYLARLGEALDPRIDLLWTGRAICSATLDLPDAQVFEHTARRPPLYWDNYPVNDVAMGFELHVGPYRGRDPRLAEASRGVIANPMELFEASKIAIATIADYLADPRSLRTRGKLADGHHGRRGCARCVTRSPCSPTTCGHPACPPRTPPS